MGKFIDISGQRYGKLVAIMPTEERTKGGGVLWLFKCDCGNEKTIPANSVRTGLVQSCGCLLRKHGMAGARLFNIWVDMRQRCTNPNSTHFQSWGGKGVSVCDEWNSDFRAFRDWALNNGYNDSLSLDRRDVEGNYEPCNCRWATSIEQARNTTANRKISIDGDTRLLCEWLEISPVTAATYYRRKRLGLNDKDALFKQPKKGVALSGKEHFARR